MKPKDINKPSDLIVGDVIILVTWDKLKATAAKIEKVAVDKVFEPTHLNMMYGPGNDGLGIEWDRKKWIFEKRGGWDFRNTNWQDELPSFYSRQIHRLYRFDQLAEAERFAKVEVPKRQLAAVLERIDKIKQNFTSKMDEMEELEIILTKNCNAVQKEIV
jgi:hypothetical protein